MGPDPEKLHNGTNFKTHSEYIINDIDDDEMEVDEERNEGYRRLNLENGEDYVPANDEESSEEESDEEENEFSIPESAHMQQQTDSSSQLPNVPSIQSVSSELVAGVWNQKPSGCCSNIEITSEKSEQITKIMSNINLPNAPNWLSNTESILDRLRQQQQPATAATKSDKI